MDDMEGGKDGVSTSTKATRGCVWRVPICARKSVELRAISLNLGMCLKSGSLREFSG